MTEQSLGGDCRLVGTDTVAQYLVRRGLLDSREHVDVRALGGGVSNIVLAVEGRDIRWVVKQSLPRLRVAQDWPATRRRIVTEGRALHLTAGMTPGAVPEVVDVDAEAFAITIQRAPASWTNWKDDLLAERVGVGVAGHLGQLLGCWHAGTSGSDEVRVAFDDAEAFDQLRIDPYYRTVAARHPELAPTVGDHVSRMAASASCLVHGDFSPKNVLVGPAQQLWVLDFEVAHYGDPAFDLAFLVHHLVLKSVHRPRSAHHFLTAADAFLRCYGDAAALAPPDLPYVLGHVGCLLLARVDGKSPAEYLAEEQRSDVRQIAICLLQRPTSTLSGTWDLVHEVIDR